MWETTIAEYEKSGETHAEFCARRRLSIHSLRTWLYRLRRERAAVTVARSATKAVQMVPVRIRRPARTAAPVDDVIEVAVRGAIVRVRVGQDTEYVAELAAALSARC